jgi:hypothetical protein
MALRGKCANCGRDLREADEPRRDGKTWFCSQSCFLQAASNSGTKWKPRRKWRRRILWTLGVVFALFVGLVVLGAVVGTPKNQKASHRTTAAHRTESVSPKPKPTRILLGSRARPIPIGRAARIGDGWRMTVVAVRRKVSQRAIGFDGERLPAGAENIAVGVSAKYLNGGSANPWTVVDAMETVGSHKAVYTTQEECFGHFKSDLGTVFSGHAATVWACFQIAANDASTLRLFVTRLDAQYSNGPRMWFRLR